MATNKLTEVAGLVAQAVMGAKVKDKDGNAKTVKPTGDDNLLDLRDIVAGGSRFSGGDITPDDGTDTSGGVNIIPGSLSDGSLCRRYLEWEGQTKADEDNTIEFKDDVGTNLNRIGDGLQFKGHLQKIAVVDGVKSDPTTLQLKYDPKNVKDSGYFVTTSPIPFSISRNQFNVGRKLTITLNGIGEGLADVKSHVSPTVSFTFNADKSMKIETTTGHDLDAGTEDDTGTVKTNGAIYTYVLERVNSYSVQAPITQLPAGISLMSGDASGDIPLNFVNDDFSNISGLQITFNPKVIFPGKRTYPYELYVNFDDAGFGIPQVLKISKDELFLNKEYAITLRKDVINVKTYQLKDNSEVNNALSWNVMGDNPSGKYSLKLDPNSSLKILNNKIHFEANVIINDDMNDKTIYSASIIDVSTY